MKPDLHWFQVSARGDQFYVGAPLDIVGVGTGYTDALEHAKAALEKPHLPAHRDLLAAACNEFADAMVQIAHEDGNALSLGAVFKAMLLEAAGRDMSGSQPSD